MERHQESVLNVEDGNSKYNFWDFKGELEFADKWFLMGSPVPITLITISYLIFVLKLGPELMKNRSPYKLTNILTIYNTMQVIFSCMFFVSCIRITKSVGLLPDLCNMLKEEYRYQAATMLHYYLLCKLVDLLDTIFFVLRKKQNQVTFLHVYHHCFILLVTWIFFKFEPGYNMLFLGTANSFVHIIMYSYYGLSAFPSMKKYLWWKKYITKLQLLQFMLILIQFFVLQLSTPCKASYIFSSVMCSNGFVFLYLFGKFYVTAYLKKSNAKNQLEKDLKAANFVKYANGNKGLLNKIEKPRKNYIKEERNSVSYETDDVYNSKYKNGKRMSADNLVHRKNHTNSEKRHHESQEKKM